MKPLLFFFFSILLFESGTLQSQDSIYLSQDFPTVRVIAVEKDKGIMDQPWFPSLLGAIIGSTFGLITALIIMGFNNRRANRLREQDHCKEILRDLYEAQTDLTPVFVKLRSIAYNLYFLNFSYNYDYCKAYQLEEEELDQYDGLIKSKEENVVKFNLNKDLYNNTAADSTKYFMKFQNRLKGDRRTDFKNLMNKLLRNDFYVYDYFNPTGEDAEQEDHSTFYPLKNEIHNTQILEHFHKEITEPIQKIIMEEIKTVLVKVDELGKSKKVDLFFFKIPIN